MIAATIGKMIVSQIETMFGYEIPIGREFRQNVEFGTIL